MKTFKKSVLLFILVVIAVTTSAQQCKYIDKEKLDKWYNGQAVKQTRGIVFFSTLSKTGSLSFLEMKDYISMNTFMDRMYGRAMDYLKTDPFIFYFSDTTIKLYPLVVFDGTNGVGNMLYSTYDAPRYKISKGDIEILATKSPIKIEIYYTRKLDDNENSKEDLNDEFLSFKINKKIAKRIMNSAKCFLEY